LTGAYVHGSAALGGFQPGRSDVDVLLVVADELAEDAQLRRGAATPGDRALAAGEDAATPSPAEVAAFVTAARDLLLAAG
jgi:hypothetical protein